MVVVFAVLSVVLFILLGLLGYLCFEMRGTIRHYESEYSDVINVQEHCDRMMSKALADKAQIESVIASELKRRDDIHVQYERLQYKFDGLQASVTELDEEANLQSFGFYVPKYDFPSASRYETEMKSNKAAQKAMIKRKGAAICNRDWSVDGSQAKGRQMIANQIRLILRAFNSECDAAMSRVKYNNIETMEKRIIRAFDAINKMMRTGEYEITRAYLNLKLKELWLLHEYAEKRRAEADEQKLIKQQMREEAKAEKEIEKAARDAQREELSFQKALEKAQAQSLQATDARKAEFERKILELQQQLRDAQERNQRAVSQSQLTRSGHVYIISNIGSFGEGVYKIGMTRRLEPMLRVKELGDASVPFAFDVHAMIYSKDAPSLENQLHKMFDDRRVNKVNKRKEYFRVSLDEIERAVRQCAGSDVDFVRIPDAEEFHKTRAQEKAASHPSRVLH